MAWGIKVTLCPDSSLYALDKQPWGWRSLWLRLSLPGVSTDHPDPSETLLSLFLHLPPQGLGAWSCLPKLMPASEEDTESGSTGP